MALGILIVAEGGRINASEFQAELGRAGLNTRQIGPTRGIASGVVSVVKWAAEFAGSSSKIADGLTQAVLNKAAGATVKVHIGTNIVEVSNVNRGQLIELLDKAAQIASGTATR